MRKKLDYLSLVIIILLTLILLKDIRNSDVFLTMVKILKPFIYGFIISYFLNPVIEAATQKFKIKKIYTIAISYIILTILIYISLRFLVPIIISYMKFFIKDLPNSLEKLLNILDKNLIGKLDKNMSEQLRVQINYGFDSLKNADPNIMTIIHYTKNATDFLMNLIIGMVISIYFIKDKERLTTLLNRLMYSYLDTEFVNNIMAFFKELNEVFYRFLLGKVIDSAIMGLLFYIMSLIIGAPYTLIMAIIFGITNILPYFGPLIGIISCFLISLIYAPDYSIIILILALLLQQFDGFFLGPKILGGKVGLSPFWTMATILISGGLFGITGMLLAVPAASVIKGSLNRSMEKKLEKKNIKIDYK
ncbi:MAG: AI-2E family transporter [Andreesenia angusta]|nr:AI-2E family transporter [Andreesenia angusta]